MLDRIVPHTKELLRIAGWLVLPVLFWSLLTPGYTAPANETKLATGGRIIVTGSSDLSNLISQWAEDYGRLAPGVPITIADPGSTAGVVSLLNGSADVVLASTPLSHQQADKFVEKYGYAPTVVPVAKDGVAVYVNSLNPLRHITLAQLDAIYSATLRCGAIQPLRTWGKLGVEGGLSDARITAFGLTDNNGAYLLFKQVALCGGDFRTDFQALTGPDAVAVALGANPAAIGFSSSALHSVNIRALAVASRAEEHAVPPSIQDIQTGRYPLSRTLSVIINIPHGRNTNPTVQSFLDYVLSAAGQAVASQAGYVPLAPQHLESQQ